MDMLQIWDMLLYLINIVILYFFLRHFVHKPVSNFLKKRRDSVDEKLKEAEEKCRQAEEMKKEYEALIESAKQKSKEIVARGQDRADAQVREAVELGQKEYKEIIERALKEIELERRASVERMRQDITDMAVEIASRILEREVTEEDNRQIIEEYFKKVG